MHFENISAFRQHFERLTQRAEHLHAVALAQENQKAAELIRQQCFRLRQGPVRALVLGVSSAGKSTLINAIAGEIVVPEGKQTTSPIPVWVYRDDTPPENPRISILEKDAIRPQNCGRLKYLTDYCYTATEAGRGIGQEKYRDLKAALAEVNSPALETAGVTLIDTPGIGVSKGDNSRVREVLADGCEMLIIAFMNLQEQEVKEYFAELLAEENAPLGTLLDKGRVFLVLNATDELHADPYAVMDTRAHIRDAFYGWDGGDRLFVLNALEARVKKCGFYNYEELLAYGFSEQEREDAIAAEKKERKEMANAQPQAGLDALCEALGMEVQALCASDREVDALLGPVEAGLEAAVKLLEQPYLDKMEQIQKLEYPLPQELVEKRDLLQRRLSSLQSKLTEYEKKLSGGVPESESRWPVAALAKQYLTDGLFHSYDLMGNARSEADDTMVELIQSETGLERWNILLRTRMTKIADKLKCSLQDRKTNTELQYWQELFAQMQDFAQTRTDDQDNRIIPMEKTAAFQSRAAFVLDQAAQAGAAALSGSGILTLTEAERGRVSAYFREKRGKVMDGGLLQGWRLFWLFPDVDVEILEPLLERVIRDGTNAYVSAYRSRLWGYLPQLKQEYLEMLTQAGKDVGAALELVRQEIGKKTEAARQADLKQVQKELTALGLRSPIKE